MAKGLELLFGLWRETDVDEPIFEEFSEFVTLLRGEECFGDPPPPFLSRELFICVFLGRAVGEVVAVSVEFSVVELIVANRGSRGSLGFS